MKKANYETSKDISEKGTIAIVNEISRV